MSDDGYVLTRRSAERTAKAVRTVERWPVDTVPGRSQPRPIALAMAFVVTTQITAATAQNSPGFGYGTMQDFNATSGIFAPTQYTDIKIWSLAEIPIAVNSMVQCVSMYGQWFYDVTMCGNGVSSSGG